MSKEVNKSCFVIMPIADCEGYEKGHFAHVYNDIIKPAIEKTEFVAPENSSSDTESKD